MISSRILFPGGQILFHTTFYTLFKKSDFYPNNNFCQSKSELCLRVTYFLQISVDVGWILQITKILDQNWTFNIVCVHFLRSIHIEREKKSFYEYFQWIKQTIYNFRVTMVVHRRKRATYFLFAFTSERFVIHKTLRDTYLLRCWSWMKRAQHVSFS